MYPSLKASVDRSVCIGINVHASSGAASHKQMQPAERDGYFVPQLDARTVWCLCFRWLENCLDQ